MSNHLTTSSVKLYLIHHPSILIEILPSVECLIATSLIEDGTESVAFVSLPPHLPVAVSGNGVVHHLSVVRIQSSENRRPKSGPTSITTAGEGPQTEDLEIWAKIIFWYKLSGFVYWPQALGAHLT